MGDISLKSWANCANSDTSMKISDKHHDSISFTHGLLAIIFFSFFQDGHRIFQNGNFFSYGIYFRMKYGLRYTVYCYKNKCKYNRDALFSIMFSVDVVHKLQCACAYFTTFYHQIDSLFFIQFD